MSNESSTVFKPLVFNQPLTVLLLIENSQKMFSVWRELREYYLNPLVHTILRGNNSALTSLILIESSLDASGTRYSPRQIPLTPSALLNINFDVAQDGRISPSRLNDCIKHLDDTTHGPDGSATLHLVIVAASSPSYDCTGITSLTNSNSPWDSLAGKLSERNIHCHLIGASGEDITPLTRLFEHTLYLQHNVEAFPPFPIDQHRYILRLSARPFYHALGDLDQNVSTYALGANAMAAISQRNSHQLDLHFDGNQSSGTAFTPQNEISLVSQLKLAQGLIKKKQHSKDPQPAPFIADARVQDTISHSYPIIPSSSSPPSVTSPSASSSSSASTLSTSPPSSTSSSLSSIPLTSRHRKPQSLVMAGFSALPPGAIVNPTNGGRAMSAIKADRKQRVSQASSGSSPTDSVHVHMRRGSQVQLQGAAVDTMNASGPSGSPGSWFTSNSHGLPQVQQFNTQRGSRLSTPDHDLPMSSSALSMGPGTMIGTSMSAGGRGVDVGIAGTNIGSEAIDGSVPPSIGAAIANGGHDISPGSVSSYLSSDMSSPTTPGSTEDLSSYARMHAFHRQGVGYQVPYQQNGVVAGAQDGSLQRQVQSLQIQEGSLFQHQEHLPQVYSMAAAQQSHFYPGAYDPTSNYFPPELTVPTQQYYMPQQGSFAQQPGVECVYQPVSGVGMVEPIQDVQTQQSSVPLHLGRPTIGPPQTFRHNSYPNARPSSKASPPPMIVPSQSHVPLTAVNQASVAPSTALPVMEAAIIPRSSPPRPTIIRSSTGPQAQGRTRASTVGTSSNLKNNSTSKIAKSKRHKKSASSISHAAVPQSTVDPHVSSSVSGRDEILEMCPLYAASTGVLFESTFNIKSGLLDVANAEDVALVAPALGMGEGPNVYATLPSDTVETAGGLFRFRVKERGGVVDEVSGTALVPVPAATVVTGTSHDNFPIASGGVGPSVSSTTASGDLSAIQFVDATTTSSMSRPTYPLPSASYPYEAQQVAYGTLTGR